MLACGVAKRVLRARSLRLQASFNASALAAAGSVAAGALPAPLPLSVALARGNAPVRWALAGTPGAGSNTSLALTATENAPPLTPELLQRSSM